MIKSAKVRLSPRAIGRAVRSRALWRRAVIALHDTLAAFASMAAAYWLRYMLSDQGIPNVGAVFFYSALFAFLAFVVLSGLRIYRDMWRFVSLGSLGRLWQAVALTTLLFLLAAFMLTRTDEVPRMVPLIAAALFAGAVSLSRILWRTWIDGGTLRLSADMRVPVLLIGAGPQADGFIRAMRHSRQAPYRIDGLLSQDRGLKGRRLRGAAVFGTPGDLRAVVERLKTRGRHIQKVIFTNDEPYAEVGGRVVEDCEALGLSIARLPHSAELRDGIDSAAEVRPVALEDLLGRPQVHLDEAQLSGLIRGRRVMVTGAGGSIGTELTCQIALQEPAKLILLDHSEFNLYTIDRMMAEQAGHIPRRAGLCDVRDRKRVARWFADEAPEVVFHAAALKHVPLVECHASDGVLTNVIGTRHVAEAAQSFGVAVMVLVSTDKAINPTNVMGATKRVAESYCQALDLETHRQENGTRYVTVRFGNVLGSAGSVVPLFQEQLARGGPLTVTHPDVQRYFMTIPEAVQLVLQASASAVADRSGIGQIFVLDMGKPIRIADLARQMIRLSGKRPDTDVKIEYIGLRPGEKLMEELAYGEEGLTQSEVTGVLLARPAVRDLASLRAGLATLETAAASYDNERCVALLRELLPEFAPENGGGTAADPRLAPAADVRPPPAAQSAHAAAG